MNNRKKVKMRKATRYICMLLAVVLFALAVFSLYSNLFKNNIKVQTQSVDTHVQKFSCKYTVNLKQNDFINETTQTMGQYYITDLIDNINMDLNYNYKTPKSQSINYSYQVVGKIVGVYTRDGEEQKIWEKTYDLTDEKTGKITGTEIKVAENLKIDVSTYNKIVRDFEETLKMSVDAIFKVELRTNVVANSETTKYVSDVQFDVGKKTTNIVGNLEDEKTGFSVQNIEETKKTSKLKVAFDIITLIVAVVVYRYIAANTKVAHNVKNTYRLELNRILKLCQDKIVQVRNKPDIAEKNVIDVKDFGEIIKVSEELFKPILYWDSKNDEAWFIVMSSSVVYRYILK